jgi:hypothetical protein
MTDDVKTGPLPGAAGSPGLPTGGIPGTGVRDIGQPGAGGGGVQPAPNPSGIPGKSSAGKGEDKCDLAPSPDQALNDIKKGSR